MVTSTSKLGLVTNLMDKICYFQKDGFQVLTDSCNEFVLCLKSNKRILLNKIFLIFTDKGYAMKCPPGLEFNNILSYCTYVSIIFFKSL